MNMKGVVRSAFLTSAVLGMLWLGSGVANASIEDMRFKTNFSFIVNGKTLPPGSYQVLRIGNSPYVLEVTNGINRAVMLVADGPNRPGMHTFEMGVVFEGADGHYVLRSMWDEGFGAAESLTAPSDIRKVIERGDRSVRIVPATR
jgi:hypothetical protein